MDRSEIVTDDSVEFVRQADGRWRWHARTQTAADLLAIAKDAPSMLSFKTEMEAAADVAVHAHAERDATGRQVMTRDYLRRMISAIALPCGELRRRVLRRRVLAPARRRRRQLGRRDHERHRRLRRLPGMRRRRARGTAPPLLDRRRGLTTGHFASSPACCMKPRLSSRCQLSVTLPSRTRRMSMAVKSIAWPWPCTSPSLPVKWPVSRTCETTRSAATTCCSTVTTRSGTAARKPFDAAAGPAGALRPAGRQRVVEELGRQRLLQQVRAAVVPEAVQVVDRREDRLALRRRHVARDDQLLRHRHLTAVASSTCAAPAQVVPPAREAPADGAGKRNPWELLDAAGRPAYPPIVPSSRDTGPARTAC